MNQMLSTSRSRGMMGAVSGRQNGFHTPASSKPSQNGPMTRASPQWLSGRSFEVSRPTHQGFWLQCFVIWDSWNLWAKGSGSIKPALQPPFWRAWKINNPQLVKGSPPRQRPRPRQSRRRRRKPRQTPRPGRPAKPPKRLARLLQKPLNPPEFPLGHSPRPFRTLYTNPFP